MADEHKILSCSAGLGWLPDRPPTVEQKKKDSDDVELVEAIDDKG